MVAFGNMRAKESATERGSVDPDEATTITLDNSYRSKAFEFTSSMAMAGTKKMVPAENFSMTSQNCPASKCASATADGCAVIALSSIRWAALVATGNAGMRYSE